ncbi:hypothetical protein V6N13_098482 [Hibiscus sabdariffa]|uniref:LysM domain-containing protein n=1 Tax=Hibiscus sabdariffa TaxID=183260 RepID=A0ABR2EDY3_9ROSI
MERERRNSGSIADGIGHYNYNYNYNYNTNGHCTRFCNGISPSDGAKIPSAACIEHPVSRFDTLAGLAIKYGVEVADIKKMNGLVTDLQMFAFKTLLIPLPGRHPPSPSLSNDSPTSGQSSGNQTPTKHFSPDWLESFQSSRLKSPRKVSPAMSSLQGYYGLNATHETMMSQVFEMAVYIMSAGDGEPDKSNYKLIRRRQKSEADFSSRLLKEENSSSDGGFPLSERPTVRSSRMNSGRVANRFSTTSTMVGNGFEVRRTSSTSCLQLHDHRDKGSRSSNGLTSPWAMASKWRQPQPQVQAFSTAAASIQIPIFDGFAKPMSARKNKAALD